MPASPARFPTAAPPGLFSSAFFARPVRFWKKSSVTILNWSPTWRWWTLAPLRGTAFLNDAFPSSMVTLRTGTRLCTPVWIKPRCSSPLFQIRCSRGRRMRGSFVFCANSTRLQKSSPLPMCLRRRMSFSTQAPTTSTFRVCGRQAICSKPCAPPETGCLMKSAPPCAKSCSIAARCSPERESTTIPRCLFFENRAALLFAAPKAKSVRENHVTENLMRAVVGHVDRGIDLEIFRDVPGEANCNRITRTALPINLHPPGVVEIVGVTEDCFVAITHVGGAADDLVMLAVVTSYRKRLRVGVEMRRPINKANRQQPWLLRQ